MSERVLKDSCYFRSKDLLQGVIMKIFNKTFFAGEKPYRIYAQLQLIGIDIVITVFGGDMPHIGAIAIGVPRPSLKHNKQTSASTSVITITGHKEDDLAKKMANLIASSLNKKVVLTAGMHWKEVDEDILLTVKENCFNLANKIIRFLIDYY